MDNVVIRPAKAEDVRVFFGTLPQTVQAWAVDYNGELAAIAGIARHPASMVAFSYRKPDVVVSKMTIWRTALKLWEKMKSAGHPVIFAIADDCFMNSPEFLKRLGFTPINDKTAHGEVFVWQTQ